jgi:hypothetical protein
VMLWKESVSENRMGWEGEEVYAQWASGGEDRNVVYAACESTSIKKCSTTVRMEFAYQSWDCPPETPPANRISTRRKDGFEPWSQDSPSPEAKSSEVPRAPNCMYVLHRFLNKSIRHQHSAPRKHRKGTDMATDIGRSVSAWNE